MYVQQVILLYANCFKPFILETHNKQKTSLNVFTAYSERNAVKAA